MKKIILISHGNLCVGMKNTLTMFGNTSNLATVCLDEEGIEAFEKKLNKELEDINETIILTDIIGGSPYQIALNHKINSNKKIEIIAGMNLAMALEAINGLEMLPLGVLVEKCIESATESISQGNMTYELNEGDE